MAGPPSNTRSKRSSKFLGNYTFLLDENYCSTLLRDSLTAAGWSVVLHRDVLPAGVADSDLLEACARNGYVLITPDDQLRLINSHRTIICNHKLCFVVLRVRKDAKEVAPIWAAALLHNQGRIFKALRYEPRPFCVRITFGARGPCEIKPITPPSPIP